MPGKEEGRERNELKKTTLVTITAVLTAALFCCSSCADKNTLTKADLLKFLEIEWGSYKSDKAGFNGGLAMQILSPNGDYFISTGMADEGMNNRHFRIASVTKTFTAAGIMLLNQRGLINIDDKITANIPGKDIPYIPDSPEYAIPYKDEITIRMLLMHRAGIFDVSNDAIPDNEFTHGEPYAGQNYLTYILEKDKGHTFTFDELAGVNARGHLSYFKPGTSYHYSDTGYSMLGKIIERVSGKAYGDFIRDELLVPNKLTNTTAPWKGADRALPAPFIKGYVWTAGEVEDVTLSNMSPHVAEGNIISTPIDLANWCRMLFKGEAGLTKETIAMMKSGIARNDEMNSEYGLGLVYYPGIGYGHAGAHEGYLTLMYYDPDKDTAYVMFTNMWDCRAGLDTIKDELKSMMKIAEKILHFVEVKI